MGKVITGETLTGEIVLQYPSVSRLFVENKIDFFYSGNIPLKEALTERNLDVEDFLVRLNALAELEEVTGTLKINWEDQPISSIIRYIINKHHHFLREELPEIETLVNKMIETHGIDHPELITIRDHLLQLNKELLKHITEEENTIFPKIEDHERKKSKQVENDLYQMIQTFLKEHDRTGDLFRAIRLASNDYDTPKNASSSFRLLYRKLSELESNTFEHIHLENHLLYKKWNESLDAS